MCSWNPPGNNELRGEETAVACVSCLEQTAIRTHYKSSVLHNNEKFKFKLHVSTTWRNRALTSSQDVFLLRLQQVNITHRIDQPTANQSQGGTAEGYPEYTSTDKDDTGLGMIWHESDLQRLDVWACTHISEHTIHKKRTREYFRSLFY